MTGENKKAGREREEGGYCFNFFSLAKEEGRKPRGESVSVWKKRKKLGKVLGGFSFVFD